MKEIVLRSKDSKKIYQFLVHDAELEIAKKLGLTLQQYVTERAKLELTEKGKK
jgi:hypothetical protein